jgi:hypothetical protein
MKNLILIAFLFVTICCKAQTTKPIEGFLGIKFGSSSAQVIDALKAKGATLNAGQTPQSIGFSNVSLGTRKARTFFAHFVNDQAYEAVFVFAPDMEAKAIEYFNSLVNDINEVYGKSNASKKFKPPYEDGDGYEVTAIKTGNAEYRTEWKDGENYIVAAIKPNPSGELCVRLYYVNGKLGKVYEDQQKAKNKSEF